MSISFIVVRLGKDSIEDIAKIDSFSSDSLDPYVLYFKCKQVESSITVGSYALIYLGSDNNKGTRTSWKQGIRALGILEGIDGWINFQSECTLRIKVFSIFNHSIDQFDFIDRSSTLFKSFSQYPIIGVKSSRNNSVQKVNEGARENTSALLTAISSFYIGLRSDLEKHAPELIPLLSFFPQTESGMEDTDEKINVVEDKNRILYGPPGTGKTYSTINHALSIINGYDIKELEKREKEDREFRKTLKSEFDGLVEIGQIQFVTFHQSYSYEEFVEGIKPSIAPIITGTRICQFYRYYPKELYC